MATSVTFDTNTTATDRLGALFKAATNSSKPPVNLAQLTQMSKSGSTPSLSGSEQAKTTSSSSSKPPSALQVKRQSKSLKSMFGRSRIQSPSSAISPPIEEESASLPVSSQLPRTPPAQLVNQALELTSQELTEDISVSTTTPVVTPMTSMNPFLAYIDTSPIPAPAPSITESLERQIGSSGAPSTTDSESHMIHSIISKAKRMSIISLQAPRPTSATSSSTTSGASSKQPLQQAPPTKKRSSIFPMRANRSQSSASVTLKPIEMEGQPFFKALAEARCHSILPTSKLPADSIVTMSHWKESDSFALGRQNPLLGSKKSEKARLKLKKQQMDVITKAGWSKKLYLLTAGSLTAPSYMLQYTAEGKASRAPEKTYQLTKHSKVFVTDAIPGRHWVLQISKLIKIEDATAETRKAMSRLSFKPAEPSNGTANLLLVLESAEEMAEWLASVRQEIEILGGKARKGEMGEVLPALEPEAEKENIAPLVTEFSKREARNSESDRVSWGALDKRMSYRPSVDAASSTLSSAEDKKLDSLRNSGHSRISSDNNPQTPASSTHSSAGSVSYSPVKRTFFFDDTPEESGSDRGVDEPFLGQTTRITADNVNTSTRPNARAIAERRRSFQPQPTSPLVTEISRPGTSGADTTPSPEAQPPAWPRTRSQRRKGPPTALLNTAPLSVVQDQPSPAMFAHSPTTELSPMTQPTSAQLTEEETDQFPAISPAEFEAVANVPIPPRSTRRQSYQTPFATEELPQFEFTEPTVTPKMHKRFSRTGEVNIMFWGNDNATQAQNQEKLLAPSSPSQRSRKELGRSDPFDLERHLAAVSPVLPPDPMDRHSVATSASVYSDDGAPSHYSQFDEENYQQQPTVLEEEASGERASLVPLPLSPYSNEPSEHEQDLSSPIGRANARAQALRAERAKLGVSKRDSWILQQPQRSDSVTKNRRQSTRFPVVASVRPPQPLSSRGFLNLADSAEIQDQINIRPSNMVKRSASEVATATVRQYHLPQNHRASAQPLSHIGAMMAEQRPDVVGSYSTPVSPIRKLSGSLASPPRRSTMSREPAVAHPATRQRGGGGSVSGGLGGQYGAPLAPPPSMALPMVPGGLSMPPVSMMGSLKSARTHKSGSLRGVEGGSSTCDASSAMSIRYEEELGRRW